MHGIWSSLGSPIRIVLVLAVGLSALGWLARRYERDRVANGEWDASGPLDPSDPPPRDYRGHGMEERREVIGEWQGERRHRQSDE
jgi:hypothetical protein